MEQIARASPRAHDHAEDRNLFMRVRPSAPKLNLGCGRDVRDGYVNVDGFVGDDPRVTHMDFTRTPWAWEDDSFDEIYASHVLEHVPHVYEDAANGTRRDVLFAVMEEAHRVLRPGGIFHIRVPYGRDPAIAWGHPQHYRAFFHTTWDYFKPDGKENWYSSARFEVESIRLVAWGYLWSDRLRIRGHGLTVHLGERVPFLRALLATEHEMIVRLRAHKPPKMERHPGPAVLSDARGAGPA